MTGFRALLKKELKEQLRTHRLLIVSVVFLVFGLATPLLIKYLPQLIELAGEDIPIQIPPPTAVMAIGEYADTLVQLGVLVAVLVTMGTIARERERGIAAMVLSKPVGSGAYVAAKLTALSATFLFALVLGSGACYAYTVLLIGQADVASFVGLNLLLYLFFVVCLAVTLLFSSFLRSPLAAGGVALAVLILQALLTAVPLIGDYLPGSLTGWGIGLLAGSHPSAWPAVATSFAVIVACLLLSQVLLRRKEL